MLREENDNDFWYTPPQVWAAIGELFDGLAFDPCPVNPAFDGLKTSWRKECYINPPYSAALKAAFIDYGIYQWLHKDGLRYLWLFNYANSRDLRRVHDLASAVCIPYERIKFIPGRPELGDGESPRYNNIFILWGDKTGFREAFRKIGFVY